MFTPTASRPSQPPEVAPGVVKNPFGGYYIHVILHRRETPLLTGAVNPQTLAAPGTPVLAHLWAFEDCVLLVLQGGQALVLHVSDPAAAGSVLFFHHANGTLWRAVPLERLNPGWVLSAYRFDGDLADLDARLARMRCRPAAPPTRTAPTFWRTGGWQGAVVFTGVALVGRIRDWQFSPLPQPAVSTPTPAQVEALSQAYPVDVQQILALRGSGVTKVTYQIGGLNLALNYLERLGLAAAVDRYCPRTGLLTEGTVITVLVVNRLLAPCALHNVAAWVRRTGLHLLQGIPDPALLNYDRLVDALLAVAPHWQTIAAEVTLQAVAGFGLQVETVHYDLTSILFHGAYADSAWVEFGYSRDHRPDKPQVTLGLSTTADGEVVLPGASDVHPGNTTDVTTTVAAHQQLAALFQRSDILVTGDRIMQSAANMLTIARAHGRFLGPVDWTPAIRRVVAGCCETEFQTLPASSSQADHPIKAAFRHLRFKVKEPLSEQARQAVAQRRHQQHQRGRLPSYREVHFWVRAAVILDTARQTADAAQRQRRLQAYADQLAWVDAHLNKGRFYTDPAWVADHLVNLAQEFKDVAPLVQVTFTTQPAGALALTYQQRPDQIAKAAQWDGKWVLVSNQPLLAGQSTVAYLDWMWRVYKNHSHVERRMRNLKRDLPIRPIYLHRDDAIVALCFVSVVALMLYTLIERDCQNDPTLVAAGLTTTDQVLGALAGFGLTVLRTPSGWEVFWLDTPTATQQLVGRQLRLPDPGIRLPVARSAPAYAGAGVSRAACATGLHPASRETGPDTAWRGMHDLCRRPGSRHQSQLIGAVAAARMSYAVGKVLIVMLCWKWI